MAQQEMEWQRAEWPERPLREDFFHKPVNPEGEPEFKLGLTYEPYRQLESIGFSWDRVGEARRTHALDGQVVVVVGVKPNGIGEASMFEAAAQGAKVVGVARSAGGEVDDMMQKATILSGEDSLYIPADITTDEASEKIIKATLDKFGRIDGLVLAAGQNDDMELTKTSRENWKKLFDVNFWGQAWLMQDVLKVMEDQEAGKIAVVSSVGGARTGTQPGYGPAKAALENLVRSVPLEYVRLRGAIDAGAIASGFAKGTKLTEVVKSGQEDRINETTKAERSLHPAEPGGAAVYLLHPNVRPFGKVYPIVGRGPSLAINEYGIVDHQ